MQHSTPSPSEASTTWEGSYALHDFRRIDWGAWHAMSTTARKDAQTALAHAIDRTRASQPHGSSAVYTVLGHKADVLFVHLRPSIAALHHAEQTINTTAPPLLSQCTSTVSVVEMSNYMYRSDTDPRTIPEIHERLYPTLPPDQHICFYPMSKRRMLDDNWYRLPIDERRTLMRQHSITGRNYAGKVKQMITGSIGFDDWEWGVTLFAHDPLQFKKIVYDMRFDEVSARYAEFGSFFVGTPASAHTILPI
jgi:chlorite dismutase